MFCWTRVCKPECLLAEHQNFHEASTIHSLSCLPTRSAQQAASVQAEAAQLAAAQGQQAHGQALLTQRCSQLEQEVAR